MIAVYIIFIPLILLFSLFLGYCIFNSYNERWLKKNEDTITKILRDHGVRFDTTFNDDGHIRIRIRVDFDVPTGYTDNVLVTKGYAGYLFRSFQTKPYRPALIKLMRIKKDKKKEYTLYEGD